MLTLSSLLCADDAAVRFQIVDERDQSERSVTGRVLITAADGGVLVEDEAGTYWNITPDRLQEREDLDRPFSPLERAALGEALRQELGDEFQVVATQHYVLFSDADPEFTDWTGRLFERLLRAFLREWRASDLELQEPSSPLAAVIFGSQQDYAEFATRDAGPQFAGTPGYYSLRTNRIVLYELAAAVPANAGFRETDINRRAAAAPGNVSTIVHEATHQIAFNCGLHTRYADNPLWVTEGLAMYCETPDLNTGSGWTTIGRLNSTRLRDFRTFTDQRRASGSLTRLLQDDVLFRDPEQAADAYAQSWALTWFLIRTRRADYVAYLQQLSDKPRLHWNSTDERIAEFESVFGDLPELDAEFQRYMSRIRNR